MVNQQSTAWPEPPAAPPPRPNRPGRTLWIILAAVAVALVGVGAGLLSIGDRSRAKPAAAVFSSAAAPSTSVPASEAPETSAPGTTAETSAATPVVLAPGQTLMVTASEYGAETGTAEITVTKVVTASHEPGEFGSEPEHGWYAVVYVKVVNTGGQVEVDPLNFYVKSSNGFHAEDPSFSAAWGPTFEGGTLHNGEHASGTIVFDVPTRHGQVMLGDWDGALIGYWRF